MKYLLIFICLFVVSSNAVEVTTGEGIHITADSTAADLRNEVITYTGNVVVTQDNMQFKADFIREYRRNKVLIKLVGKGNPALYIDKLATKGDLSKGTATELIYKASEAKVYLKEYTLENSMGDTITSNTGEFLLSK